MGSIFSIPNLGQALSQHLFPTVTLWNRLEGRPRTENFARALRAEVRDALWMLTKQWQMGEFAGDDAGTPVFAKAQLASTRLTKYRGGDQPPEFLDAGVPLEARVEQRPVAFALGGQNVALDLRLLMGRQWIKLVSKVGNYARAFTDKYPVEQPDPTREEDAPLCAHQEVWQGFAAAAGRLMDGAALYFHLKADASARASDGVAVLAADKDAVDELGARFVAWFEKLLYQPADRNAWEPSRLEYRFACSAPDAAGEKVLTAEEYYQGRLDWYNFDADSRSPGLGVAAGEAPPDPRATVTQTLIPTQVVFDGMPNTRWWAFEDRQTNFGDVKPDTTDLAKLLLIEFGLVYANDWFLLPFALPVGSIAKVRGMAVTNVFGERVWVEPAGRGAGTAWQRWGMFTLNTGGGNVDTSLLLLPTVPKGQEGPPLETVVLIRDEMANMVWGIEKTVRLASGDTKQGREAAAETLSFYKQLAAADPPPPAPGTLIANDAKIRYQVMSTVPENWIPFIPVHVEGDNRETQLQRAAMPRVIEGDPQIRKVRPRTSLLREGLDQAQKAAYYLHEEEVPRAGVQVSQSFQRTRWRDGGVFIWLGARKQTGRGEGSSGLAFDSILDVKTSS
ncbi:MAG TPA: hypothetical protein VF591_21600 [Pyrinomonadaceae bacterium]|jgi:hypothetical protein